MPAAKRHALGLPSKSYLFVTHFPRDSSILLTIILRHQVDPFRACTSCRAEMPHLPVETWEQIFSYIHRRERQKTFASCCLVSYAWYDGVVGFLYRCPDLLQGDLPQFLQLVCAPFSNLHSPADDDLGIRKRIRRLDIGNLVHDSSMPSMELLLKATKAHLTEFVSPTVAFRYVCFYTRL